MSTTTDAEPVLRPDLAFVMTHMMTGMFDKKLNGYASVTGSTIIKDMTRTYAGKSGSTNSDSWMIGFTRHSLFQRFGLAMTTVKPLKSPAIKYTPKIFGSILWKKH